VETLFQCRLEGRRVAMKFRDRYYLKRKTEGKKRAPTIWGKTVGIEHKKRTCGGWSIVAGWG